ncbi:DUF1801 domain-containing protein [Lujinxingia vulgaris]|uniref:DUF1801 domain-containing protein n=1 Tax=Lujinxingia vulgaris TaxID=2600176 RepID=A0A5C6XKL2_9DELT|nr:DUF1801 domain-containing protein [Lujinxingia vulgaris]TXD39490.1 DUF1801 domain-containing protein [Lujinxingia vulgaris]
MSLKTQPTDQNPAEVLNAVEDPKRREDCLRLLEIFEEEVGAPAVMWGDAIVGFGTYHYVYKSGREGDWMLAGFSPRKRNISLYIMSGFEGAEDIMGRLGKHKTGKSCLYINKLADIDEGALRELIQRSLTDLKNTYETTPA